MSLKPVERRSASSGGIRRERGASWAPQAQRRPQPVVLFDQFDDYLRDNRSLFIRGSELKLLTSTERIAQNSFRAKIAGLLKHRAIHCLSAPVDIR